MSHRYRSHESFSEQNGNLCSRGTWEWLCTESKIHTSKRFRQTKVRKRERQIELDRAE